MKTSKVEKKKKKSNSEKGELTLECCLFLKSDCALVVLLYNPVGFEERGRFGLI